MYNFSEIQSLHIELTTKCNAACPMCPRTIHGGVLNPNLYTEELGMDFFQEYFPKEWLSSLRDIFFCGNYGDPAAAQDTLEVFSYLRNANPALYLHMHTNGSIRDAKWWGALAKIIGKNGNVSFGVDGLEDTLQLYRVGCSYPKIMENARAFIQAGAEARWNFYVFEHNEHQIEQAAEEAKRIGFRKFVAKKTGRFFNQKTLQKIDSYPVLNKKNQYIRSLKPPKNFYFRNSHVENSLNLEAEYGSMLEYLDHTPITCQEWERKRLFLSAKGWLLPCGYLNHQLFDANLLYDSIDNEVSRIISAEDISLYKKNVPEILSSPTYARIMGTWQKKSLLEGKLKICALTCGKQFDKIRAQTENTYVSLHAPAQAIST